MTLSHHHPPTTTTTHTNSMSAISQLLLTRFWQNFKVRSLGPSWTDFNCHRDICPGNICHDDICPCPEYLSCYRPDFDQTLKVDSWDHLDLFQLSWRHLFRQHLSWQHLSISGISRLLLTRFWPNFKSRLLGPCWTVMVTCVQATFVLATFVHIENISAVIHLILTKL